MPLTFAHFLVQAADDVADVLTALVMRLQIDQETPAVERRIGAVDADEGGQAVDIRVFQDRVGQRLLPSAMAAKEIDCGASEMPWMRPVSCTGKKPLGMTI